MFNMLITLVYDVFSVCYDILYNIFSIDNILSVVATSFALLQTFQQEIKCLKKLKRNTPKKLSPKFTNLQTSIVHCTGLAS